MWLVQAGGEGKFFMQALIMTEKLEKISLWNKSSNGIFLVFIKKAKYCKVVVNYVSAELRFKCNSTVITSLIQILKTNVAYSKFCRLK